MANKVASAGARNSLRPKYNVPVTSEETNDSTKGIVIHFYTQTHHFYSASRNQAWGYSFLQTKQESSKTTVERTTKSRLRWEFWHQKKIKNFKKVLIFSALVLYQQLYFIGFTDSDNQIPLKCQLIDLLRIQIIISA